MSKEYYREDFNQDDDYEYDYVDDLEEMNSAYCPYFNYSAGCIYRTIPPFGPMTPPPFGGPQGPQGGGAPTSAPPSFTPSKSQAKMMAPGGPGVYAVDPGAIRPCTFRFIYIWQRNGRQYWAFLTYVGRRSASGFRWNGRRWVYFGIDLRQIDSFVCY